MAYSKIQRISGYLQFLTVVFCSILVFGCGGENPRITSNTFFYNEGDEMKSLDPVQINQRSSWWVGELIYVGLVGLDENLRPIPRLAESWEVSEDGKTLTFNLRDDIRFVDDDCFPGGKGRTVTAQDVQYSLERVCDPSTSTTGFWLFRGKVVGADAYYEAREQNEENPPEHVEGFRVVDDRTFQIELTKPFPPFISMLSIPFCYVVPKEGIEKYGADFFRNPVGAGAFKLSEWTPDERIILVKNPSFYEKDTEGNALPYLDSVWISFIREPGTIFNEFTQGNIDLLSSVDPAFADRVLNDDGKSLKDEFKDYTLHSGPALSTEYYGFMLDSTTKGGENSPFAKNKYLRKALNYAINREKITRFVLKGQAIPANHGPIPPLTPGFSQVKGYTYDMDMALRYLDSAGYPNGEGLPDITLQLGDNKRTASVAEAVQQDFKKIGIQLNLDQVDFSTHLGVVRKGEIPFWRTSWIGDYPDGENFVSLFYSQYAAPSGPNTTRFSHRAVDSLYEAALQPGLTIDERAALYGEAESIILDEAPWIFLYYNAVHQVTQPWITGYRTDPLQRLSLTHVRKQPTKANDS